MPTSRVSRVRVIGVLLAVVVAPAVADATTIMTNEGFTINNTYPLPGGTGYGSNVSVGDSYFSVAAGRDGIVGTPNIAVFLNDNPGGANFPSGKFDGWANWPNAVLLLPSRKALQFDSSSSGPNKNWSIVFTPASGYDVALNSFVFDAADNTPTGSLAATSWSWAAVGTTSGTLASGTWARTTAGRDTIAVNAQGANSEPVSLNFTFNAGAYNYVALDDVTYDQVVAVPEPALLAAATLVGTVAFGTRRLRSRSDGPAPRV